VSALARLRSWLRAAFRGRALNHEMREELRLHAEMHAADLERRGVARDEAVRRARAELGSFDGQREAMRQSLGLRLMDECGGDLRHALRALWRSPAFTAVAVLSLALGIGANTVIFSVVDAALFRPLPYAHADRLVHVFETLTNPAGVEVQVWAGGRRAQPLRSITAVFDGAEAYSTGLSKPLAEGQDASPQIGGFTPGFPSLLGVPLQLGRGFTPEDVASGDRIILSDGYWRRAFKGDREVIGKTIAFTDRTCVVIGVMPPTFRFLVGAGTDGWLPLGDTPAAGSYVAARLRPGLTLEQAQRDLKAALTAPIGQWRPIHVELARLEWNRGANPGRVYSTRTLLFTLAGAVGILLLIACANVANLLISRTLARQREIAVRRSLGASRTRLARQFLTEGLVLAGLGSLSALAVAWIGIRSLPSVIPNELVNSVLGAWIPSLDGRALTFGCAAALFTGLVCGTGAAMRSTRSDMEHGHLSAGQRQVGSSRAHRRLRDLFQTAQIALTLVLLVGAGLFLRSLARMTSVPHGYATTNLAYASLSFPRGDTASRGAFFDTLTARLEGSPAFAGVAVGPPPPAGGGAAPLTPEGMPGSPSASVQGEVSYVSADYFRIAGIQLRSGRSFDSQDHARSTPVAVVSESTARRLWPDGQALGRRLSRYDDPPATVVGIVDDIKTWNLPRGLGQAYLPTAQRGALPSLLFRTSGDLAPAASALRSQVRSIDPRVTVTRIGSVETLAAELDPGAPGRLYAWTLGAFATLALLTAGIGLYGLVAHAVTRRTNEIGVRMALGASIAHVRWVVFSEALRPVVAGLLIGLAAAAFLSRLVSSQLFQITPHDPGTLALVIACFAAVSIGAVLVPVRRATRVDPMEALRAD
jgi:predicted permease